MKPIVKYNGKDLFLTISKYSVNDRLYIGLVTKDGELWDDLTINLVDALATDSTIFINDSIQKDLKKKLYQTGVFVDMFLNQPYNMGNYDVVFVNEEKLKEYIEQYKIEIWETEEDRDLGNGFIYNDVFDNFNDALTRARDIYDNNMCASIEILDNENEALFCKDSESEEFYFNNNRFCLFTNDIVDTYIDNWFDHKPLPTKETKIYCKMVSSGYLAVDNSTGECYVEEFDTEKQVHEWLLGNEKSEILTEGEEDLSR